MRACILVIGLAAIGLLAAPGCEKKGEVDTTKLQTSFQSADPDAKTVATRAIDEIKAGNYQAALNDLQSLLGNAKLTPEQKGAVQDTLAQVREKVVSGLKGTAGGVQKGTEDLKKSLGQ